MNRYEKGWAGERFVKNLLRVEGWTVIDLAPAFPCDLLGLMLFPTAPWRFPLYQAVWVEVKVKTPYRPRLTPPEARFLATRKALGDGTRFYWLRREGETYRYEELPIP